MALDGTYAGMQASIADFLARGDLTSSIPDFIILAEAQINRRLRVRQMISTVTATVSDQFVILPPDFASILSIQNALAQPMDYYPPDAMVELTYQNASMGGTPTAFTILNGVLQFYPIPSDAEQVLMSYYQKLPPLSLNASGNWLSQSHPDAYLYGALTQSAPYLAADDRVEVWGSLFQAVLADIVSADTQFLGARLTPQPSPTQII